MVARPQCWRVCSTQAPVRPWFGAGPFGVREALCTKPIAVDVPYCDVGEVFCVPHRLHDDLLNAASLSSCTGQSVERDRACRRVASCLRPVCQACRTATEHPNAELRREGTGKRRAAPELLLRGCCTYRANQRGECAVAISELIGSMAGSVLSPRAVTVIDEPSMTTSTRPPLALRAVRTIASRAWIS